MKLLAALAIVVIACGASFASRVLVVYPLPSKSHLIVVQGLTTTLAKLGHEITVISPYPLSKKLKNYRDVEIPIREEANELMRNMVVNPNQNRFTTFPSFLSMITNMSNDMMNLPEFKKIMKEEKFDLVVIGMFFNNFLLGFGDHFKCPTMMLSANQAFTTTNLLMGNPLGISAVPHMMTSITGRMGFIDRTKSFLMTGIDLAMNTYMEHLQQKLYDEYFPSSRYISYDESKRNISLTLLNSHFSQGTVRPYVQGMIEVGGLQVKPKPDPLPADIKQWLDEAKNGAIFFSFGSNAKAIYLPKEKIQTILAVFSKLKQRVIMKWETDTLEGKPDNVLIGKWLPQDDILAHKNVKLFVSHCGLGGVAESKYHGVPIVGLPIFGDQEGNAEVIVNEGWVVKVDFATMTEKSLSEGINEVLTNPIYTKKVKEISTLYRDRPMNARDTAVYWVEYIIRHHGAPHIQYQGIHLNLLQRASLDVIGFLLVAAYISIKLVICSFKFVFRKIFKRSTKPEKANKKKKN